MCMGACDDDEMFPEMDHFSGSWIQNRTTGPRVFLNEGIGMILDPQAVSIQCLYPLDAGTIGRSNGGCGPNKDDGFDPSHRDWRMIMWLYWRKITKFGYRKKWEDIPCSKFFNDDDMPPPNEMPPPMLMDHNNTWMSSMMLEVKYWEAQMGHVICYDDYPNVTNYSGDGMLLYLGPEPWVPSEWDECVEETLKITKQYPKCRGIWNEVVMEKPDDLSAVVQAIFYINPQNREQAYWESERLGHKPVLALDPFDLEHLFQCPPEEIGGASIYSVEA